jgi:hypothetical protein
VRVVRSCRDRKGGVSQTSSLTNDSGLRLPGCFCFIRRPQWPTHRVVNLVQCPYDGAQLEAEVTPGGTLLITCPACDAVWETHGAWVGRLREPDREKMLDERRRAGLAAQSATERPLLAMTLADVDHRDAPKS